VLLAMVTSRYQSLVYRGVAQLSYGPALPNSG
jgi:hypothetical protein